MTAADFLLTVGAVALVVQIFALVYFVRLMRQIASGIAFRAFFGSLFLSAVRQVLILAVVIISELGLRGDPLLLAVFLAALGPLPVIEGVLLLVGTLAAYWSVRAIEARRRMGESP